MKRTFLLLLASLLLFSCAAVAENTAAPAATIEEAVENFLQTDMAAKAKDTEDGWQRFLYEQGVSNIEMNLDKFDVEAGKALPVTFTFSSGAFAPKTLPKYEGDPGAYLTAAVEGMKASTVKGKTSLTITAADGGYVAAYAPKAEEALVKAVKTQAAKGSKSFADKTFLAVITDYLIPAPITVPKKAPKALDSADYRPAFTAYLKQNDIDMDQYPYTPALLYGLKSYKLDVSGGPESIVLTYARAQDLKDLMSASCEILTTDLAYDAQAKKYTGEDLSGLLVGQVDKDMIAFRHGKDKGEVSTYTFSLLSLPQWLAPEAFYGLRIAELTAHTDDRFSALQSAVEELPDYPAVATPKTGWISGSKKGSSVQFKAPKDGILRAFVVYDENGKVINISFLNPGTKLTMYLPDGKSEYQVVNCYGKVWYGPEHLFGEKGGYLDDTIETLGRSKKTTDTQIITTSYFYVYTLPEIDAETYELLSLFGKPLSEVVLE